MEKKLVLYLGPEYPEHIQKDLENKVQIVFLPILDIIPINKSSIDFLNNIDKCDWIVFTSPRGPKILANDAKINKVFDLIVGKINNKKLAAVGSETAKSIEIYLGRKPDLIPKSYTGKELGIELSKINSRCVLLARSKQGLKDINEILKEKSINFVEINLYEERLNDKNLLSINEFLIKNDVQYVLLSSPLIAEAFCNYIKKDDIKIVSIGPSTYSVLKEKCPKYIVLIPQKYTLSSAIELIKNF
ncbi:uroporphyrinogen-III synthase [Caldisphaera sp.]|uniref:uroporphyrinogen-III synthase n=1 Tax=Caldisphaera sp. TaxID=2060322 RepID=UPI0025C05E43|nr:uroporphyrinogen-III synthase [Caldisphaera sp.]